jgi:hypothetical protein
MSAFWLKIIAIAAMSCDHMGAALFPDVLLLRAVGRLTMPIMAFFIAEGSRYTGDIRRYFMRLMIFGALSEIPFDLALYGRLFYWGHQNVLFTLALGLAAIYLADRYSQHVMGILGPMLCAALAQRLNTDYGYVGVLMVFGFWLYSRRKWGILAVVGVSAAVLVLPNLGVLMRMEAPGAGMVIRGLLQLCSLAAVPLIASYDGRRGMSAAYVFYVFYPAHLLVLGLIRMLWRA